MIKSTGPDSACLLHSRSFNSGSKHLPLICLCSGCADVWPTEWGSSCCRNEGLCSGVSCNAQWKWSLDTAVVPSFHHFQGIESFLVRWRLQHLSVWDGLVGILFTFNPSWCQVNQSWIKHFQLKHLASSALFCSLPHMQWSHRAVFLHDLVGLIGFFFWGTLKYFHQLELVPSDMHNCFCCV